MMESYHKINTIFKRDKQKKVIEGEWSVPEFEYLQHCLWNMDEKIDGMNIRVDWDTQYVTIDGRNENSSLPAFLCKYLFHKFNKEVFEEHFKDVPITLYGEGFGYGLQGKMGIAYAKDTLFDNKSASFLLFDVRIGEYWLERYNVQDVAEKLKVGMVPFVDTSTFVDAIKLCKEGFESNLGVVTAEGLVMRPIVEMYNRKGERIIAKLKVRDFK